MTELAKVVLTYPEHQALAVLRKSMRNPDKATTIFEALLKGQSKTLAYTTLKQVGKEMTDLLAINRAFADATQRIMKELYDGNSENQPS